MKFRTNLIGAYLLIALVPLLTMVWLNYQTSKDALIEQRFASLEAIAEARSSAIKEYFHFWEQTISIVQNDSILKAYLSVKDQNVFEHNLNDFLDEDSVISLQLKTWKIELDEISDIVLLSPDGMIINAPFNPQEHNVGSRLYDTTNTVVENARNRVFISDLFLDLDQKPKFFVGAPIYGLENQLQGMVVFEVDAYKLYAIIQDTTGLGETGETVIGKLEKNVDSAYEGMDDKNLSGDRALYLNPLRYDSDAAFERSLEYDQKDFLPIQNAVLGRSGFGIESDYRGEPILAVWRYLPIRDWGLVTKIDYAEVLSPVKELRAAIIFLVSIITCIILFFIWIVSGFFLVLLMK